MSIGDTVKVEWIAAGGRHVPGFGVPRKGDTLLMSRTAFEEHERAGNVKRATTTKAKKGA